MRQIQKVDWVYRSTVFSFISPHVPFFDGSTWNLHSKSLECLHPSHTLQSLYTGWLIIIRIGSLTSVPSKYLLPSVDHRILSGHSLPIKYVLDTFHLLNKATRIKDETKQTWSTKYVLQQI